MKVAHNLAINDNIEKAILEGYTVYVLDKLSITTYTMNTAEFEVALEIMRDFAKRPLDFCAWYVEEVQDF